MRAFEFLLEDQEPAENPDIESMKKSNEQPYYEVEREQEVQQQQGRGRERQRQQHRQAAERRQPHDGRR